MKAPSIENMSMWNESVYNLEPNSLQLFDEIMEMLGRIEPMRSNGDYKRIWLSEERGAVADMRFDDIEEAMEYFETDNESDLNSKFLERYPDEKSWFLLESLHNEECRVLKLRHFTICIYNGIPDHADKTEYEYTDLLQWIKDALSAALTQAESRENILKS